MKGERRESRDWESSGLCASLADPVVRSSSVSLFTVSAARASLWRKQVAWFLGAGGKVRL